MMNMLNRLLVPVDFSEQSLQMFECISHLCVKDNHGMVILHVLGRGESITSAQRERIDEMLESVREMGIDARFMIEEGNPVETILQTAEREAITMIAMASSGKGMAREFIVGSTSLGVIRGSSIPVFVDKCKVMRDAGDMKAGRRYVDHLKSAIIPLDFTTCNEPVLEALEFLIGKGLKRAVLFHVVESSKYRLSDDDRFHLVKEKLKKIKEGVDARDCEIITHIHFGNPVFNIIEVSREFDSSLIVMGTHGKSLLHEMTLGSISEDVIRKVTVSLLIVQCER